MKNWTVLADDQTLKRTVNSLKANGIEAVVVASGKAAKKKVLDMLPEGAEVMTMTSVTLDSLGITDEVNTSGRYHAVRPRLFSMDRQTEGLAMQKLGAAPEWTLGSVHAVTETGQVVIASNTGSQLAAYAYGSVHVIWVIGAQKIVKNMDEAIKRVYDHVLPLESERAIKAYGATGSNVSKLLVINKEVNPTRITLIIVKEKLGF